MIEQHKIVVKDLMKDYQLNFSETQTEVFINHLVSFYDRIMNKTDVGLELNDELRLQVSKEVWIKSETLVKDFLKRLDVKDNVNIPEAEVFLVATHLSLL